jgi:subtilase family serine protease
LRHLKFAAAAAGAIALAGVGIASTGSANADTPLSRFQTRPGVITALARLASAPTTAYCETNYHIACYSPNQLEEAYGLPTLYKKGVTGKGQTIVIVDSFGSPTIARDLATFDKTFHLPAPPSLKVIQPAGKFKWQNNPTEVGWAGETTLDVEYAHAVAPGAKILLVETPTAETEGTVGFPEIVKAEQYVVNHHLGNVISQSFSATEQTFPSKKALLALRTAYTNAARHHVTVLAATGDNGAANTMFDGKTYYTKPTTTWPPSDPLVTAVGGTQLHLNAKGDHTTRDTVWNDTYDKNTNQFIFGNPGPNALGTGGAKSVVFARPSWQNGVRKVVGNARGVPDISMSGACNGAVDVYQSFPGTPAGWAEVCGTSEATPLFAGIVALSDQVAHHGLGVINPALYSMLSHHARGLVDVTSGNNTVTFTQGGKQVTVKGFNAAKGYDLASGVGTVWAPSFVPELAKYAH